VSAWSTEGVWKCLFPKDAAEHRRLFEGSNPQYFKEYTALLEFRRGMRNAERERERSRWSRDSSPRETTQHSDPAKIRFISESEADRVGKTVVSSQVRSETVSKDDGTLETKRVVKKYYDDNTASVSETVDSGKQAASNSGWFWH
jgi:hypothetical protein